MAAPSIIGVEAPYTGESFGALYESCLNERGLTNSAYALTDATLTSASTRQVAMAKKCVKDAIVFMQDCRERWWPLSEATLTAVSDYSRVILPTDFNAEIGVYYAGKRLIVLNTEQYAANIRPDTDGGGLLQAQIIGEPTHARFVMSTYDDTGTTRYQYALEVYPIQTAAWSVRLIYRSTAKALSADGDVVRLPVRLHPLVQMYTSYAWRLLVGDAKGAAEFFKHFSDRLEEVREAPTDEAVMRAVAGIPNDNTRRYG